MCSFYLLLDMFIFYEIVFVAVFISANVWNKHSKKCFATASNVWEHYGNILISQFFIR